MSMADDIRAQAREKRRVTVPSTPPVKADRTFRCPPPKSKVLRLEVKE